jgi:hypothetical protein
MPFRAIVLPLLAVLVVAPPASAAFSAPVELARGDYGLGLGTGTDAAGATTAIVVGATSKRLIQRPGSLAPWPAGVALSGALGVPVGPVVSANGRGAVAAAWRLDRPQKYQAIAVMASDPGGPLSTPVVLSPGNANGVRHPAVAVAAGGSAVLAYNTNTRASHLSLRGAVAISLRHAGGAFGRPVTVDAKPSMAPLVAIADDGRGLVAWVRDRRVWAASVDARTRTVGRPKAVAALAGLGGVGVAAGPGGAGTIVLSQNVRRRYVVQALARRGGGAPFPRTPQTVWASGPKEVVGAVRVAADEDGRTTLVWAAQTYGQSAGVTGGILTASLDRPTRRFRAPATVVPDVAGGRDCVAPVLAARTGHATAAWECRHGATTSVFAATLPSGAPTPVLSRTFPPRVYQRDIPLTLGLDASGLATITTITSELPDPDKPEVRHLLATTGR